MAYLGTVADSLMPPHQMRLVQNMDVDQIGFLVRTQGYQTAGSGTITGGEASTVITAHWHNPQTSANRRLVIFENVSGTANMEAFYLTGNMIGGGWTNKNLDFTAGVRVRAATFLGYLFAVNGTDTPKSWTGATGDSWGATNLTSVPNGHIVEPFRQQLYIVNTDTDTVNFSTIPTAGAITWPATNNFVVNPNDGSQIAAVRRLNNELIIAKRRFMYRYNGKALDNDPVLPYGAYSQEATVVFNGAFYFYDPNRRAIFAYAGGYPENISRPVAPFLKALTPTTNVYFREGLEFIEMVIPGTTTMADGTGLTFTNLALRYYPELQNWCVRTTPDALAAFTPYEESSERFYLGVNTSNTAYAMERSNLFNATAISFVVETPWYSVGNNPRVLGKLTDFAVFVENSGMLSAQYKTDLDDQWREIGQARKFVTEWAGINASFHRIKFRFTGNSGAAATVFDGFEMNFLFEGLEPDSETLNT